jgi:hypothetical protein
MKTNLGLVSGIIIIVVVIGYYGFLAYGAFQGAKVDPSQVAVTVPTLDTDSLDDIRGKNLNGNLPIKVESGDLDNPTPFLTR